MRHQTINSRAVGGAAVTRVGYAVIQVEAERMLQRLQNVTTQRLAVRVHFRRFEGDQAHANRKVIGDAARDHVDRLSKASRAIKDQREVLLQQLLYHPLDLARFDLRNVRLPPCRWLW